MQGDFCQIRRLDHNIVPSGKVSNFMHIDIQQDRFKGPVIPEIFGIQVPESKIR
jgi:hypothetical protein